MRRLNRRNLEAALVAIDPRTGDVVALVGGADYRRSTFNRATRSRRQPGSAFKPFVFAAALSRGYSPVSVLNDLDSVSAPNDPEWHPRSVSHDDDGLRDITLRKALAGHGLEIDEGTLYPLLRRLESQGFLLSEWREHEKRTKRFYRLSADGARTLQQLLQELEQINSALNRIVPAARSRRAG